MTKREIRLGVQLFSERERTKVLEEELKKALRRVFELEFPQMGIKKSARPSLKVVNT